MSNSTLTPSVDKQDWAQAADKAKEAAAYLGEMASRAASTVGEMASQAANSVGTKADDLTAIDEDVEDVSASGSTCTSCRTGPRRCVTSQFDRYGETAEA